MGKLNYKTPENFTLKVSDFQENYKSGYRLFYGSTRYHPLVGWEKPYDRGQAWMWLILEACGKKEGREVQRNFGGKIRIIREEYGQVTHSERFMADAWGWSRQKVSTLIRQLSNTKTQMISQNVSQQINQITICNFEDYQKPKSSKQASSKPAVSQQQASSKPNYNSKEGKKVNKKEKDMFGTTLVETEPLNNKYQFSDHEWSKELLDILKRYQTLNLVTINEIKNVEFWDGHIEIMSDYFISDSEMKRWFNSRMFEINTWQRDNPQRASKSAKGLRQRISRWLSKEYQKLEVSRR